MGVLEARIGGGRQDGPLTAVKVIHDAQASAWGQVSWAVGAGNSDASPAALRKAADWGVCRAHGLSLSLQPSLLRDGQTSC